MHNGFNSEKGMNFRVSVRVKRENRSDKAYLLKVWALLINRVSIFWSNVLRKNSLEDNFI